MSIKFNVNGLPYEVQAADYAPDTTLNTFLREHLHLTATKFMCLEGGCGSCICVISRHHPITQEVQSRAANSVCDFFNAIIKETRAKKYSFIIFVSVSDAAQYL